METQRVGFTKLRAPASENLHPFETLARMQRLRSTRIHGKRTFLHRKEKQMAIHTIAEYQVRSSGVDKVKRAIAEFVPYVRENEPGTRVYLAWQKKDDPTRFVHFFIFENEAALKAHSESAAVKQFEAAYRPELVGEDVV